MHRLRLLLAARPLAALWLVVAVLAVRMLVPAGYMPVAGAGGLSLGLCPGTAATAAPAHPAMAGMHHGGEERHDGAPVGATAMPCAFAGLGVAAVAVPAMVLAVLAAIFAPPPPPRATLPPRVAAPVRWRPPLRAPPLG